MKLIHMRCPGCGSNLDIDLDGKQAFCQFCGAKLLIDDEVQRVEIENSRQAGYEFEKGRQKAREEAEKAEMARKRAIKEAEEKRRLNYERHHRIAEEQKQDRDAKYGLTGLLVFLVLSALIFLTMPSVVNVFLVIAVGFIVLVVTCAATQTEYHYSYTEQAEVDDDGEILKIYDNGKQVKATPRNQSNPNYHSHQSHPNFNRRHSNHTVCTPTRPAYTTQMRLRARYRFASANNVQQCWCSLCRPRKRVFRN